MWVKYKPFYIQLSEPWFKKGDLLYLDPRGPQFVVIKYYRNIWWRRWLQKLGMQSYIGLTKIMQIDEINKT